MRTIVFVSIEWICNSSSGNYKLNVIEWIYDNVCRSRDSLTRSLFFFQYSTHSPPLRRAASLTLQTATSELEIKCYIHKLFISFSFSFFSSFWINYVKIFLRKFPHICCCWNHTHLPHQSAFGYIGASLEIRINTACTFFSSCSWKILCLNIEHYKNGTDSSSNNCGQHLLDNILFFCWFLFFVPNLS